MEKLEWCGCPTVKKFRRYLYSFWHNSRTWQTDTHTHTPHDGIGRADASHRAAIIKKKFVNVDRKRHFFAAHNRGLYRRAVYVCLSFWLSRSCILSNRINASSNFFTPSGSHAILVPYQTLYEYSDAEPPITGASNAGAVGKNHNSGFIACCQQCDRQVLSYGHMSDTTRNQYASPPRGNATPASHMQNPLKRFLQNVSLRYS